ncbi:MAG: hypothetical protein IT210_05655 [Armatimonadetes bacterium]|nr:hypothetical protein [Armatimonadota bacterium]
MSRLERIHPWWPRLQAVDRQIASLRQAGDASAPVRPAAVKPMRISLPERTSKRYVRERDALQDRARRSAERLERKVAEQIQERLQVRESEITAPAQRRLQEDLRQLQEEMARQEQAARMDYLEKTRRLRLRLVALKSTQESALVLPRDVIKMRQDLEAALKEEQDRLASALEETRARAKSREEAFRQEAQERIRTAVQTAQQRLLSDLALTNGGIRPQEAFSEPFLLPPLAAATSPVVSGTAPPRTARIAGAQRAAAQALTAQRVRLRQSIREDIRLGLKSASLDENLDIRTGGPRLPSEPDVTALVASYLKRDLPEEGA